MAWRFRTFRLWSYVSGVWIAGALAIFGFDAAHTIIIWPSEIFWLPVIALSVPVVLLPLCWLAMWSSDRAKGIEPPYWPSRRTLCAAALAVVLIAVSAALSIRAYERETHNGSYVIFEN
jgi:hypothetical protein